MKFLCKRGGLSGVSSRGGGGAAAAQQATTPSGVTYEQFMQMTDGEKYNLMEKIINDSNITVPSYLDDSNVTKFIYAIGMSNKPTVMSDSKLDKMVGVDMFRTVYHSHNPPPYAKDILSEIKNGDYTRLSSSGGSLHGKALYFASDFTESLNYAGGPGSLVMRAKVKLNANIVNEDMLYKMIKKDKSFKKTTAGSFFPDNYAFYALSHGIDGWRDSNTGYTMIINRGALAVSSVSKHVYNNKDEWNTDWKSSQDA